MDDNNSGGTAQNADASAPIQDKIVPVESKDSGRYCWVCFATDEDDETAAWVQPCNCKGTTKWVSKVNLIILLKKIQDLNAFRFIRRVYKDG